MVQMLLDTVELYAFKGKTLTIHFNEDTTDILGTNGSGKGILAEAICWGLTGEPLYGDRIDLFTKGDTFTYVTTKFSVDGKYYLLTRELKKTSTGATGTIRLNHEPVTAEKVHDILKVPSKLLKALMFPRTFMVGDKDFKTKVLYETDSTKAIADMQNAVKSIGETQKTLELLHKTSKERLDYLVDHEEQFKKLDDRVAVEAFGNVSAFIQAEAASQVKSIFTNPAVIGYLEDLRFYGDVGSYGRLKEQIDAAKDSLADVEESLEKIAGVIFDACSAERKLFDDARREFGNQGVYFFLAEKVGKTSISQILYKDLPISSLSGAESIEAACKIHKALTEMCGFQAPVVIENAGDVLDRKALASVLPNTQCVLEFLNDSPLAVGDADDLDKAVAVSTATVVNRTKAHNVRVVEFM